MSQQGLTVEQIAVLCGVTLRPEQDDLRQRRIVRVGSTRALGPQRVDRSSLVFAEDEASLAGAVGSDAGLILAGASAPVDDSRVLRVVNPRYAFALCARELGRDEVGETAPRVHASASVDPSARLGARVVVGAGAVIEAEAEVGDDSVIGSNTVIAHGVVLGRRVVVQSGAVLGSRGFGYVRHRQSGEYLLFPQQGALVIEDDVEIGANTTIDRGALEETRIGRGTKIDNLVHIGHNCRIGKNVVIAAQVGISGSCVVGDGAILAGQVGISDHCKIGPGVILGGQAGVYRGKSVTGPGEVFAGTPAEPLRDQMRGLAKLRALARQR